LKLGRAGVTFSVMHTPPHPHRHSHRHDHGHSHAHGAGVSERRIGLAALLTGLFMVAEVAGGVISGSLALIADAGHMLTDTAGLVLAWLGFRVARRPADWKRSYGYDRFGVLVAFANGLALFAIAGWIVVEAVHRLDAPTPVLGGIMFWVALAGLGVNLAAFRLLQGGDHANLNVRAAALHVIGDLLGSVAALAAALIILATGWTPIDPILSVMVAVLILASAARVVRDAGHILLEGTPTGLDPRAIEADLEASVPGVLDVHHVHAWSLSQDRPIVTLHARISPDAPVPEAVTAAIKAHLRTAYGVDHATVELEFERCADADAPPSGHRPSAR
jgi:cobalt-zinc-cadmium efflux system protein